MTPHSDWVHERYEKARKAATLSFIFISFVVSHFCLWERKNHEIDNQAKTAATDPSLAFIPFTTRNQRCIPVSPFFVPFRVFRGPSSPNTCISHFTWVYHIVYAMTWQQTPRPLLSTGTFYKAADDFFREHAGLALTYDDVTLATLYSETLPRETNLETELHERLRLRIPIISADMDTVTEAPMAIAMALNGGLGLIHCNLPEREQLSQVSRVKNNVHGLIQEPIKVAADQSIGDVLMLIEQRGFSFRTFPVVDEKDVLLGLLPGHTVRPRYASTQVSAAMTPRGQVQTIHEKELGKNPIARADQFFYEHIGIHKLLVVDDADRLRGLFTISDIERIMQGAPKSAQAGPGRSIPPALRRRRHPPPRNSTGELDRDRILAHVAELVERGVDTIAVSTAHGFSKGVGDTVRLIREDFPDLPNYRW